MKRPLLVVGIVAFVVVDVSLVVIAVRNVRDRDAPVGSAGPGATSPQGSSGRGSDPEGAPGGSGGVPAETVLLDAAASGAVLRAIRGDGSGPQQPRVGISTDCGQAFRPVDLPVGEVQRVEMESATELWLVDQSCVPNSYRSGDVGQTWGRSPWVRRAPGTCCPVKCRRCTLPTAWCQSVAGSSRCLLWTSRLPASVAPTTACG